jgi:hypothetical protein
VGPRAILDAVVKRKIPSPRRESNPRTTIVQPVAQRYTNGAITALSNSSLPLKTTFSIQLKGVLKQHARQRQSIGKGAVPEVINFIHLWLNDRLGPTQAPIRWVLGALTPEVERPGREADHSPPTGVEVKNVWSYTSTTQYVFTRGA